MGTPGTGNWAATDYKEAFSLPPFALAVKSGGTGFREYAENASQGRIVRLGVVGSRKELSYWSDAAHPG
jgi:hypothetical protein